MRAANQAADSTRADRAGPELPEARKVSAEPAEGRAVVPREGLEVSAVEADRADLAEAAAVQVGLLARAYFARS
jgi:hypothetical protein